MWFYFMNLKYLIYELIVIKNLIGLINFSFCYNNYYF